MMSIQRNENKHYTFQDFLSWDEGSRYEIFDGVPVLLASPTTKHQGVVSFLTIAFGMYFKGEKCRVFPSPFTVRFSDIDDYDNADNVFEPDLSIICNKHQLDKFGCQGAPKLIVEVLSPSTSRNDRIQKYNAYQKFGVPEYWIVDPLNETVEVYVLDGGIYQRGNVYGREDVIKSHQFEHLEIIGEEMFSYGE